MSGERWAQVSFRELALSFCQKTWALLEEGNKILYKNILEEIHSSLTQLGFSVETSVVSLTIEQEVGKISIGTSFPERKDDSASVQPDLLFWISHEADTEMSDISLSGDCPSKVRLSKQIPKQTPMAFREVVVCFCQKEWSSFEEKTKDLYSSVLQDVHRTLTQLGHFILNPHTFIRVQEREEKRELYALVKRSQENGSCPASEKRVRKVKVKQEKGLDDDTPSGAQNGSSQRSKKTGSSSGKSKRGRPPLYSPETARKRRIEAEKNRQRISIGKAFQDWKNLRTQMDLSNEDLALLLIKSYR
ncbi:zinc finger protein 560-like [Rhinophrynus dorsalis]